MTSAGKCTLTEVISVCLLETIEVQLLSFRKGEVIQPRVKYCSASLYSLETFSCEEEGVEWVSQYDSVTK